MYFKLKNNFFILGVDVFPVVCNTGSGAWDATVWIQYWDNQFAGESM